MQLASTLETPQRVRTSFERRGNPRVEVVLSCHEAFNSHHAIGRTVNISRQGVLVRWSATAAETVPAPGDSVSFHLALPLSRFGQRCIRCQGRVVRVETDGGQGPLVALSIPQMEFRDCVLAGRARAAVEEAWQ